MCGKDSLPETAIPAMPTAAAPEPPRKMRSITELRRDYWKRQTERPSETQQADVPSTETRPLAQHSRDVLLAARLASFSSKAAQGAGISCVAIAQAPRRVPNANRYSQDPDLDDEHLIMKLEERESREACVDWKNEETFGENGGWSFEEAIQANAQLHAAPLKPGMLQASERCASTASGSRTASEGPGSESSTPRASPVPTPQTFNPNAAEFVPAHLNMHAAVFTPGAPMTFQ